LRFINKPLEFNKTLLKPPLFKSFIKVILTSIKYPPLNTIFFVVVEPPYNLLEENIFGYSSTLAFLTAS